MTDEERQLRETIITELDRLQREYRERAQPWIDRLAQLDALAPRPLLVYDELAGIDPKKMERFIAQMGIGEPKKGTGQ